MSMFLPVRFMGSGFNVGGSGPTTPGISANWFRWVYRMASI